MDVGQYFCSPFQRGGKSGDRGEREALQALCSWLGDRTQEEGVSLARSTHSAPIMDYWRERREGTLAGEVGCRRGGRVGNLPSVGLCFLSAIGNKMAGCVQEWRYSCLEG